MRIAHVLCLSLFVGGSALAAPQIQVSGRLKGFDLGKAMGAKPDETDLVVLPSVTFANEPRAIVKLDQHGPVTLEITRQFRYCTTVDQTGPTSFANADLGITVQVEAKIVEKGIFYTGSVHLVSAPGFPRNTTVLTAVKYFSGTAQTAVPVTINTRGPDGKPAVLTLTFQPLDHLGSPVAK